MTGADPPGRAAAHGEGGLPARSEGSPDLRAWPVGGRPGRGPGPVRALWRLVRGFVMGAYEVALASFMALAVFWLPLLVAALAMAAYPSSLLTARPDAEAVLLPVWALGWIAGSVLGLVLLAFAVRWLRDQWLAPRAARVGVEAARAAALLLPFAPGVALVGALLHLALPAGTQPWLAIHPGIAAAGTALGAAYGLLLAVRLDRARAAPAPEDAAA